MATNRVSQFAQIDFRDDHRVFGINPEDRFSHIYVVGKTGTGKSTLMATMALQDLAAKKISPRSHRELT
jgi:type IV secretory pathway VirB4 component